MYRPFNEDVYLIYPKGYSGVKDPDIAVKLTKDRLFAARVWVGGPKTRVHKTIRDTDGEAEHTLFFGTGKNRSYANIGDWLIKNGETGLFYSIAKDHPSFNDYTKEPLTAIDWNKT